MTKPLRTPGKPFRLEEATVDELHAAIKAGEITCVAVVRHYIARVRAFNGTSNLLVTQDGAMIPGAKGAVRGGAPLRFPGETVKASAVLPDLDKYQGPPLEFGRMEATASDPSVQQQFGMTVGKPNAGQRTCDAQHPRRTLGHLPRRFRPASVARAIAARRAASVRIFPPFARRARTRG
jgi:hypothetical protein